MPSAIIHRCVHKKVLEKTKKFTSDIDKYIYDVSSVAPDSWRNTLEFKESNSPKKLMRKKSHFSKETEFVENYELFLNKYKKYLSHPFIYGYLVHLMTDNLWRSEVYYKKFYNTSKIDNELLNKDYTSEKTSLNNDIDYFTIKLKEYYEINALEEIEESLIENLPKIDELTYEGINTTIRFTNSQLINNTTNKVMSFTKEELINSIEIVSNLIVEKLKELKI